VLTGMRSFGRAAAEARLGWRLGLGVELALLDTIQAGEGGTRSPASPTPTPRPSSAKPPSKPASEAPKGPTSSGGAVAATPTPNSATSGSEAELADLVAEQWESILAAAYRLDSRTQALLKSGRLLGVQRGRVVLGFPTEILREKMEKGHSIGFAGRAIQEVVGVSLEVRCVLLEHWSADAPPGKETTPPMEAEGMVATAVRELGGHVVAVRPAPGEPNA